MKELFTKEKILELVKKEIKEQVAEVLNDTYYDYEIGDNNLTIKKDIKVIIKEVIKENISSLVTKEVEATTKEIVSNMIKDILENEEIINNGWDRKKIKFEQFVKDALKDNIKNASIERTVKNILDDKVGSFIKSKTQEVIEKTTDEVVKNILG